jgi:D-alanyl-D-alanine carboxypeptidase
MHPLTEWTGGGLATSPVDLARWAKLLYEGDAMPGPYVDELLELRSEEEKAKGPEYVDHGCDYGLGVMVYDMPVGLKMPSGVEMEPGFAFGHGGWWVGYYTFMLYFPEHKIAVSVQLNEVAHSPALVLYELLAELLTENTP